MPVGAFLTCYRTRKISASDMCLLVLKIRSFLPCSLNIQDMATFVSLNSNIAFRGANMNPLAKIIRPFGVGESI